MKVKNFVSLVLDIYLDKYVVIFRCYKDTWTARCSMRRTQWTEDHNSMDVDFSFIPKLF